MSVHPSKTYFVQIKTACLESIAFLPRAAETFPKTWRDAAWSLLSLIPATLIMTCMELYNPATAQADASSIYTAVLLRTLVSMFFFFGLVGLLSWGLSKPQLLPHFITAVNWISALVVVAIVPNILLLAVGRASWEMSLHFLLVVSFFGYAITAFLARHILKIRWLGAVFFAFAHCFIDEAVYTMVSP